MEEVINVEIKGSRLVCPICKCDRFRERSTLLNTRGLTFFGFDWANENAQNYICISCGHIFWFSKREVRAETQLSKEEIADVHEATERARKKYVD
jgi:hypothetical protein